MCPHGKYVAPATLQVLTCHVVTVVAKETLIFAGTHCVGRRAPSALLNIPLGFRFRGGVRQPQWTGRRPTFRGVSGSVGVRATHSGRGADQHSVGFQVPGGRAPPIVEAAAPRRAADEGWAHVRNLCGEIAMTAAHALAGENNRCAFFVWAMANVGVRERRTRARKCQCSTLDSGGGRGVRLGGVT